MKPLGNRPLVAAAMVVLLCAPASAETYYWKLATSGSWETTANWSNLADGTGTGAVPGASDDVIFNTTGTNGGATISLNANRSARSFTFNNTGFTSIQSGTGGPRTVFLGTGGITVNSGAGDVAFGDGTGSGVPLRLAGTQTWTNNSTSSLSARNSVAPNDALTVATPVTLTIEGSGTTNIVGSLNNGAGGSVVTLVKNGGGTLDRTSGNGSTYSGGTTLNGGILQVSANNQLGNTGSSLSFNGGTLRTTTTFSMARATSLGAGNGTFEVAADTTLTQQSVISGGGTLIKSGAGTLILSTVANTYTGGTIINGGTVAIGTNDRLGLATSSLTLNGGTLQVTANITTLAAERPIILGASGGTLDVVGSGITFRHEGAITGTGGLTKTGTGTLYLVNEKTYQGGTAINGGTIQTFADNRLGTGGLSFNGGALRAVGTFSMNRLTTLNAGGGTFTVDSGFTLTQQAVMSGSGGFTKNGLGTSVLSAANTYNGGTAVTNGNLTVTGSINATSALSVTGGTFQWGADNAVADAAAITLGTGGVLLTNGFDDTLGTLAVVGASTLDLAGTSTLAFANSTAVAWTGTVSVLGWNGTATGGGAEQLTFGTSGAGLTPEQLAAMSFVNPTGFAAGTYAANILSGGEVVPGALIPEPSALMLSLLGATGIVWRRRRL